MAYATINPFTEELVAEFPTATDEQVDAAISEADGAFRQWQSRSVADRVAVLGRAARILEAEKREYAEILTLEMGKLLSEAEAEIDICIGILDYYVENGPKLLESRDLPSKHPGYKVRLVPQPLGVIYAVEPWNFPFYQVIRISAPQFTAGNAIVLKHASNVPQSALAMERLFAEAGAPAGLLTNIFASHSQTDRILANPLVRATALTGSERAGEQVAAAAGRNLKKSTLELGGADAYLVLDDADVEKAAAWAVTGRHWNAGQVCVSSKRLIVVEAVYDAFLAAYKDGVAKLVAGDPREATTSLAPLSSKAAVTTLQAQLDEAVANGATAETLGVEVPERGWFFPPTLLTGIEASNPAYTTEFFGPVTQLYRVKDEAEAIKVANDSPFGLGGSVFTEDIERGQRVADALETGMVYINHPTGVASDVPFGGVKRSGYGHELIELGLYEFVNYKAVVDADIDGSF